MVLVDTNVLLDVLQNDPVWAEWSQEQLENARLTNRLAVNEIIYTELSVAFARIEELEVVIGEAMLAMEVIPREALFLAGKAFLNYRRARGSKQGVLPDFFIGAHAAVMKWPLLTRDPGRYRRYFPTVPLICPD